MNDTAGSAPGESEDPEISRGLALAWGVRASPNRGPKRELSIERIVGAGIEIADAEGLDAVSMSAVAKRLGYTTMSLYRYVTAKDELLLLMSEQGLGLPPQGIADAESWQQSLRVSHDAEVEVYLAHPWLLDLPISGTPLTPNNLAWLDARLAGMRSSGLDLEDRMASSVLMTGLAHWRAIVERGYVENHAATSPVEYGRTVQAVLSHFVTEDAFPALAEVVASGFFAEDEEDDDRTLDFGLERVLDGMALYIARTVGTDRALGGTVAQEPVAAEASAGADDLPQGIDVVAQEVTQADKDAVEAMLADATEVLAQSPPPTAPKDPAVQKARSRRRDAESALRTSRRAFKDAWKGLRDASKALRDARRSEDEAVRKASERGTG